MSSSNLNRAGCFVAGLALILLAIVLMMPLDGSWGLLPFPFSPYLEFIVGFGLFLFGLWILIDSLKKPKKTSS